MPLFTLIVAWVFVCYPIKRLKKKATEASLCPLEWFSLSELQHWGSAGGGAEIILTDSTFLWFEMKNQD